jgi:hypothetical protein
MAEKIMKQILGNNANIGSEKTKTQLWQDVNGTFTKVGNANDVFNTLNKHLDTDRPITVGVNYKRGHPGNTDLTTDHFVVVTGRGYDIDRGQYYYNYIETARYPARAVDAISSSGNRFYYDPNSGTFRTDIGGAYDDRTYSITQIRPNQ